jgi:hypothetical protein
MKLTGRRDQLGIPPPPKQRPSSVAAAPPQGSYSFGRTLWPVEPMPRDHFRIAMSLLAATVNSAADFSMAAVSSAASTVPSQTALAAIL